MRTKLENLFIAFENRHYAAVQTDTELSYCDDNAYDRTSRIAKKFWQQCDESRKEFLTELAKVDNEKSSV